MTEPLPQINELVTDEMVEKAARAEWERDHTYAPWENVPDDLRDYYRDNARVALEAAAPLIAAEALRDFADGMVSGLNKETLNAERRAIKREARARADEHLVRAALAVDSKHHIHGTTCLCGFEGNDRKRTQTEHITAAVIEEYYRD